MKNIRLLLSFVLGVLFSLVYFSEEDKKLHEKLVEEGNNLYKKTT